eukprot:331392-Chlamydomonas_euryale.AAC.22
MLAGWLACAGMWVGLCWTGSRSAQPAAPALDESRLRQRAPHAPEAQPQVGHVGAVNVVALGPRLVVVGADPVLLARMWEARVFHTCAATEYSSTSGSLVRWICTQGGGRGPGAGKGASLVCKSGCRHASCFGFQLKTGSPWAGWATGTNTAACLLTRSRSARACYVQGEGSAMRKERGLLCAKRGVCSCMLCARRGIAAAPDTH